MSPVTPEHDFPPGHPGRADFDAESPEAKEWARKNVAPLGERDFPVDHVKAADTPGNENAVEWKPGVDPRNPHRQEFTGRTPAQAEAVADLSAVASAAAKESPVSRPVDAAILNAMLDEKRADLGRDILTADEYAQVLAAYHRERPASEA
jgi:hypothetical protein